MVDNSYRLCPADSIFPLIYGIGGRVGEFQPLEANTELWGSDISLDGKYYVFGGFYEWKNTVFLPEDDYDEVHCEGTSCSEYSNMPSKQRRSQRGIV